MDHSCCGMIFCAHMIVGELDLLRGGGFIAKRAVLMAEHENDDSHIESIGA